MSSAQIFVNTLDGLFKRNPFGLGLIRQLEPYCRNIGPELAEEVARKLGETRTAFPNLATCRQALEAASRRQAQPETTDRKPWEGETGDDWRAKRQREIAAFKLCRCQLGERADKEGWLPALLEFCQDAGRLPDGREQDGVIAKARRSEDGLARARATDMYRSLVEWRRLMLERAHREVFAFRSSGHLEAAE